MLKGIYSSHYGGISQTSIPRDVKLLILNCVAMATGEFVCPGCRKVYRYKTTLVRHLRFECGKEPQFNCTFCTYRASQKNNLTRHVRLAHAEKFLAAMTLEGCKVSARI
ncbi:hypothetical protein J6590_002397 [Homalodisca vitripennis]|nr:hypothetical protein J6590_002397 [Homalodisca vitripennis]